MTFNVSYVHKNLALRWLYVTNPCHHAVIKEYTLKTELDDVFAMIDQEQIDVVGLSVYIFNHEKTKEFIAVLKQLRPHVRVICGGPEVTYDVAKWLDYGADVIIRGEGEFVFWDAVNHVEAAGIATKLKPKTSIVHADIHLLESYPNPYFLPFDCLEEANRYLYMEASRGCPFSCTYCMAGIEHNVRYFSQDYMQDVFKQLESSSVRQVKFLDRTFNVMPKRALLLIQQLNNIEREFSVQLELEVTIWDSLLHQYFIKHGKRERFRFEIGVQTFLAQTLEVIKRKQNNEMVEQVIQSLTKAGFVVHADLIGGLPFESYYHFKQSFMRLYKTQPSEIQLGILKILPGTSLSKQAKALDISYHHSPPYTIVENHWISKVEVKKLQHAALAIDKTYNRPLCKSLYYYMFKQGIDIFEILVAIGNDIESLERPYQLSDVINSVIRQASPKLSSEVVVAAIALDVGKLNRFKPKILPYFDKKSIDLSLMIKDIEARIATKKDQWFSNSWIYPVLNDEQVGYQWIVYPLHKRYYYTKDGEYLHEEDHFTSINKSRKDK